MRKEEQKQAGLKEIRIVIKIEHEKLVRLFANKLKSGELVPGQTVKIE